MAGIPSAVHPVSEPVRAYVYGVATVVVAALVLYGVITEEQAAFWVVVAGTVLAVPAGVEGARSRTMPFVPPQED